MRDIKFYKGIYFWVGAVVIVLVGIGTSFAQEPYKIGAAFGITGHFSTTGVDARRSAEMLVEEINKSGGINGHRLSLIIEDTESNDSKGILAIKKLIVKDKVSALTSCSGSGLVLASMSVVQEQGVVMVANAGATIIARPVKKWIFKTPALTTDAAGKILEYMQKQGIRRIAILTDVTAFGDEGRTEFEKQAPEYGVKIIESLRFDPKDTDMSAQLTRIRSTDAQAIQVWGVGNQPALIAKQRVQLGIKIPLFQCHGLGDAIYLRLAGEAAEGNIMPTSAATVVADKLPDSHPQKSLAMKWNARYEEKYKEFLPPQGAYSFDAVQIIANAMKTAGSDAAKLRDEIEKTKNLIGLTGVFTYSATDHSGVSKKDLIMVEVENGKYKYIKD